MKLATALGVLVALLLGLVAVVWLAGQGIFGDFDSDALEPTGPARSPTSVTRRISDQRQAAAQAGAPSPAGQILFGDLHVHTTISFDAFMLNLPLMGGEGAHPPADACDFARHCAALDFWSINDHAANIHPDDWKNTITGIRECNARSGNRDDPDMVSFLGWEWTQAGRTPEEHFGHKNVVLAHTDDDRIPTRPIAASAGGTAASPPSVWARGALALQGARFHDLARRWTALSALPLCPSGPVRELPATCREVAPTPAALFRKLDDWGHDALVIPHGTSWGIYTPPGSSWDPQLVGPMHDPERQTLIEVYSGHGGSEAYREWRSIESDPAGNPACPAERDDYLPMCQRAAQLIESRCLDAGEGAEVCAERAQQARVHALGAGVSVSATVPGSTGRDWLDAGQCRDCAQPAFHYRPMGSAQYITSLGAFDNDGPPRRFRMGFIASSDIHTARSGVGYKEHRWQTDAGQRDVPNPGGIVGSFLRGDPEPAASRSRSLVEAREVLSGLQLYETERTQSFLYTGGLVAVHAAGRSRQAIWSALENKQVYGTSGPRILLWFDLVGDGGRHPMGSELSTRDAPTFQVRAVGSFEQQPGCPLEALEALGPERLEQLCRSDCYRPSDLRRAITRIEVVRIRPQVRPDEDPGELIDDPWQVLTCPAEAGGCSGTFVDTDFPAAERDAVYYARVYEAPLATVNGDPLSCLRDDRGRCIESQPCQRGQACRAELEPRAWSSPIYVDWDR